MQRALQSKDGSSEELASLGELPAQAELSPCTPSQQPNQGRGSVGSHGLCCCCLPCSSPGQPPHRYLCSGVPGSCSPLGAAQAGLGQRCHHCSMSLPAALAVLGLCSRCCCQWSLLGLGDLEQWGGTSPALPEAAQPRLPERMKHPWAGAGLGTGCARSTCTGEGSSWLQASSKPADINSIFCCLGQKSSPCSCLGSHPAGLAPRQLGPAFLPSSPVTSVVFRTSKMHWVSADYDNSKC